MKRNVFILFLALMAAGSTPAKVVAQTQTDRTWRVGVFAPLQLDSVFKNGHYQFGKTFPRFALPALDFIQGAEIALDSMPLYNSKIDARFYDSKSKSEPVDSLIIKGRLDSLDLIIGSVKDQEFIELAEFAKRKQIPFISATYPNDGGITGNPFLVILNSTLRAHCEGIQRMLAADHKKDNIILVKQTGSQEERVSNFIRQANEADWVPTVRYNTLHTDSNFNALKTMLDSTRKNVVIGASLDEEFASSLALFLAGQPKKYQVKLVGMPNWETFGSFTHPKKSVIGDFPVYFTSSYHNLKIDSFSHILQNAYLARYKGKPSDFAYKGFETMLLFTKLLIMHNGDLMNHLNEYPYKIFTDVDIRPIFNGKKSGKPEYFENKHVYLLKIVHGSIQRAWQ